MHEQAIAHLRAADPRLARVIERAGPCGLRQDRKRTPFEALVSAVAYQQLSGKAAETILSRVRALYPPGRFPSPEEVARTPDESLRAAGLSRAKVASVKEIAARTLEGVVPSRRELARMEDEEIVGRLTVLRGVGRWTVEMLLIFKLGRPDVLPVDDYGVRKGFKVAFGRRELPPPETLLRHGERWRPFRSVATWYLWRALDPQPRLPGDDAD